MIRPLFSLLTVFTAANFAVAASSPVLSPNEALEIALKNNFDILITGITAEIAKVNNQPGSAGMLPLASLSASENFSTSRPPLGSGTPASSSRRFNAVTIGARLDWTLFDGGRMFVTRKKLGEIEKFGALRYKDQILATAGTVIIAYYDIVRQKQQLEFINEVILYNRERVTIAQTSFTAGLIPKTTLLQAIVDLNVYREKAIDQQNIIASAKRELNRLLCRDAAESFDVDDSIPLETPPASDLLLQKLDSCNTSIGLFQKQVAIAALVLRENRSLLFPKVAINLGYSISQTDVSTGSPENSRVLGPQAGASLSIPLYQGGNTVRQIATARLQLESADYELQNVRQQIRSQVQDLYEGFKSQMQLHEIERENLLLARENLAIAMQRLRLAQSTSLELRQAEESYEDSRTRLLSIEYNLKVAATRLKLLMGQL